MYYFNFFLFKNLPSLFKMNQADFSTYSLGASHKFAKRVKNQDSMLFSELIKVCNNCQISLAHFITLNQNEPFLGNKFKYVIPEDKFSPINFHPENIKRIYGINGLAKGISKENFAQTMNVSLSKITRWSNSETCFITVNELLSICNRFKIDISMFVDEKNMDMESIEKTEVNIDIAPRIWQEITELKQMVYKQNNDIQKLETENWQLKTSLKSKDVLAEELAEISAPKQNKTRKWTANWNLLNNLCTMLGVTQKELVRSAKMSNFNTSYKNGDIPVNSLMNICNSYHISTRHFFLRDNGITPTIYQYDYYRSEDWKEVRFHPENINDLFGKDSLTGLRREDIMELCEIGERRIRSWRQEKSSMHISDLIMLCNQLDVTPSCFISDGNRMELSYGMTHTEFLLEENLLLRQKLIRKDEKIKKLKMDKSSDK